MLWLSLDEGAGTLANDRSAHRNDGTFRGSPSWGQGGVVLNGASDYIEVAHDASLDQTSALTVSAWIKPDAIREWDGITSKGTSQLSHTVNLAGNGALRLRVQPTTGNWLQWDSNSRVSIGRWQHVAVTYDGAQIRFYLDGVLDANRPNAQFVLRTNTEPLVIGADIWGASTQYFDGAIRDVRVYDGALDAAAIATIAADPLVPRAIGRFLDGRLPQRTPGTGGAIVLAPAFPNLRFEDPLVIRPAPNSNRLWVGSRQGRIHSFVNDPAVSSKQLFLDLTDHCAEVWDGGLLGLAFHPEFGQQGSPNRGYFYVYYCYTPDGNYPKASAEGFFNCYLRLSRFHVADGSLAAERNSELVMLHMRLYNGSHRGGDLAFGPDGFLYVPIGDQFLYSPAQRIDDNLVGGILRLDVDRDAGRSHPPRRRLPLSFGEEISGQGYWIPDSNPFLDAGGSIFEEYFSLGHRNPHRMTFDTATGRIWSGEIGENEREEVNVIQKGHNYGWPFREGTIAGPRGRPPQVIGIVTEPALDFGRNEANAIIGGYVYRGSEFPELYGKYLCGDYRQKRIWSVTYDEQSGSGQKQLLTTFDPGDLVTFGTDHQGRVYFGGLGDSVTLYGLARDGGNNGNVPTRLSQTGAFADVRTLTPARGVVPYTVNAPLWSDGAAKERWLAVPNDGAHDTDAETIVFDPHADWSFPIGTVLIKHFELPVDERDPSIRRRLETRLLVLGDDGEAYGLTYRWRADGSDADLLADGLEEDITIRTASGGTRVQRWTYPSRIDCRNCHLPASGFVLGVRTQQLNGDFDYGGETMNQLRAWNRLGMFRTALDAMTLPQLARSAPLHDLTASVESRARSYLDSNCAACHRPDTGNRAAFDARLTTPFAGQDLLRGPVLDNLGIPGASLLTPHQPDNSITFRRLASLAGAAMPPLAKNVLHDAGLEVLRQWIWSLDPTARTITLGRTPESQPSVDGWWHTMVVDEGAAYTNDSGAAQVVRVGAFRFRANQVRGSVTPFVVRVLGNDSFVVAAIGTPRSAADYRSGHNALPFSDGAEPQLTLQPGERLAAGFLDARPDGSDGAAGGIVPYCACNSNDVWITGGPNAGDAGRLTLGSPPVRGAQVATPQRMYAFAVDLCSYPPPVRVQLGNEPGAQSGVPRGSWNLMVDETDTFTNPTTTPLTIAIESFAFHALAAGDPVTPFVVSLRGPGDFVLRAVGSTRTASEYGAGDNHLSFHRHGPYPLTLAPGETIASGVFDGSVIPFAPGGATTWHLGSDTRGILREQRSYAFAVSLRRIALGAVIELGNTGSATQLDNAAARLVIASGHAHTNTTNAPQHVAVYRFRFRALAVGGPLTPLVAKMRGAGDFQVVAIGTTRTDYVAAGNVVPFLEGGAAEVVLAPGEALVAGVLGAHPDGSGARALAIPYGSGRPTWITGGNSAADSAHLEYGTRPVPGSTTQTVNRDYAFALDVEAR